MATTKKLERTFKKFLRAQFHARIARDEDHMHLATVKGTKAQAEVRNPATVLTWLHKRCTLVSETRNSHTFVFQAPKREGGMTATVTLKHSGNHDVLTMVTKH